MGRNNQNQKNGTMGAAPERTTTAQSQQGTENDAAKEAIRKQQEAMRQRALAFEEMEARKNPELAAERAKRLAQAQAEEEQRARFKAEEEAKIQAERRVQEKKMDQTEALIAAIRAQVEKEKAAKEAANQKAAGNTPAASNASSSNGNPKPQFRTISPEEMAKLEEKKRMKAAGVQPAPSDNKAGEGISGGLGGLGNGPSLSHPTGDGPTLTNPTAGQASLNHSGLGGGGLGIDITASADTADNAPKAEERTVTLNAEQINAAMEKSKEAPQPTPQPQPAPQPTPQPQPAPQPHPAPSAAPQKPHTPTQVVGGSSTIIVDDGNAAWGQAGGAEASGGGWVDSGATPQHVQAAKPKAADSLVDDNGDIISVVPVRQKPGEANDVQSAYNIDFDDDADDDDMTQFGSSASQAEEEARKKAEEEARRKAEEEARRQAEEEARRKAEEEARKKAEEEARRRAEEEARRQAEEEARRKAEEEARKKAEEEARRKAEEEARKKAEEEARRKAEEEARRQAEEEARRKAEEEARKKAEEEARRKAEEEARRKAEEEARKKAEEEARRKAEEEARRKAEEEARRKAEEEARRKAEEEARKKAEEEARRKAEEEARRKAEEEARKKAEEEARRKAEEEARRQAEEEARRKAEEEARRQAEEEARRKAEEEARRQAEEEARIKAEEEARRKAEEEAEKYKQLAEEAARKAAEAEKALEAAKNGASAGSAEPQSHSTASGFSLPVGAEQFLGKYLSVSAIGEQFANTIKYISENPSEPRNIVILGQYGFGTTTIAEDFARSFHAMGICKTKTIAKIKAGALNRANISDAIAKLQGGCLVVENAGVISPEKLDEIYQIVSNPANDVVVIMTGQIETLSKLFKDNVVISSQFKHLIQVHRITDMDVFSIAKNHAVQLGYPCEPSAENNLRRRMQEVESGNLDRVLKIVDNAVSKAHNREISSGEQDHHLVSADFE